MAGWQLNPALTRFRAAVNGRYGARRDLESDGTIGDRAHQNTSSDHNPDDDGSVDAWDMDVDVNGRGQPHAADIEALKRVFETHPSSSYWIHNDQIARRADGWRRRPYTEFNPSPSRNKHTQHVHWNTRQSHETSTATWDLEDDMPTPKEVWDHRISSPGLDLDLTAGDWVKRIETVRRELDAARKDLLAARALLDQAAADVAEIKARPAGTVALDDEQLERALRAVLGSVDGATPPPAQE